MGLPRFAVVDLETSGLRPGRDAVLQIGVVPAEAERVAGGVARDRLVAGRGDGSAGATGEAA